MFSISPLISKLIKVSRIPQQKLIIQANLKLYMLFYYSLLCFSYSQYVISSNSNMYSIKIDI